MLGESNIKQYSMKLYFTLIFFLSSFFSCSEVLGNNTNWAMLTNTQMLDGCYSKQDNKVYLGGDGAPHLEGVDVASFEILRGTHYARDKFRVYYPIVEICVDGINLGYCYASKYVIENANPNKFKILKKDYSTDGKLVFFRGELVSNANGATVELVLGPQFFFCIKDDKRIFLYDRVLENADPKTFQCLKKTENFDNCRFYLMKDSNRFWIFKYPNWPKEIKKEQFEKYIRKY